MTTKQREKTLVLVAALTIGFLAVDSYVFSPLARLWKARSQRIQTLTRDLSNSTLQIEREKMIQARWDSMRTNTLLADDSAASAQLQRAMERWKQTSRIEVTTTKPQWKRGAEDHTELECQVDAIGNMEAVARYLYELERDPLALKIDDLKISSRDNDGQKLALSVRFDGLQRIAIPQE